MLDLTEPGELIDALGGTTAVARLLGLRSPSVADWRKTGIPVARRWRLAVIADQRNIARRWFVCPADWHLIWPELIGTPGAPPIPTTAPEEACDVA